MYRTGLGIEQPLSLAIGDLNGDTRKDLVVTDTQSGVGGVSVLVQDNLGVLVDTDVQPVGAQPRAVAIADLNDDGMPDLVTANEGADTLSLLLSEDGQPRVRRRDIATGGQPRSVAVVDLNGDGVPDLATANGSGTVSVLPGVGNGTFLTREDIPNDSNPTLLVPDSPAAIVAVDWLFAQDGKPDLVVAGRGANPIDVLVNATPPDTPAGSGVVVTPVDRSTGLSPVTITFAQVTGEGVTSLTTSASGPPPPVGFVVNGSYYHLETTAMFTTAEVCFPYSVTPPAIVHWVGGTPVIEPTTRDTGSEVCAVVDSFSPFALAQPEGGADVDAPVVACGAVDGAWHANNVSIACTAEDTASGLADPADAAFSLSTSVQPGTEDGNAATGSRQVCDLADNCATAGPIDGNKVDRKAPVLSLTADRTVDATEPAGAAVELLRDRDRRRRPEPEREVRSCFRHGLRDRHDHGGVHGDRPRRQRRQQLVPRHRAGREGAAQQADPAGRRHLEAAARNQDAADRQTAGARRHFRPEQARPAPGGLLSAQGVHRRGEAPLWPRVPAAQATDWIADANRIRTVLAC